MVRDAFKEKALLNYLKQEQFPVDEVVSFTDLELDILHYFFKLKYKNSFVYFRFSSPIPSPNLSLICENIEYYIGIYEDEIYTLKSTYYEFIFDQIVNKLKFEAKKDFFIPTGVLHNMCDDFFAKFSDPDIFIDSLETLDLNDLKINL